MLGLHKHHVLESCAFCAFYAILLLSHRQFCAFVILLLLCLLPVYLGLHQIAIGWRTGQTRRELKILLCAIATLTNVLVRSVLVAPSRLTNWTTREHTRSEQSRCMIKHWSAKLTRFLPTSPQWPYQIQHLLCLQNAHSCHLPMNLHLCLP